MYLVHLIIVLVFVTGVICSITVECPNGLKKESVLMVPFYQMAIAIGILKRKYVKGAAPDSDTIQMLMCLNPAGNGEELNKIFEIRLLGKMLMLIFVGNVLAFLICLKGIAAEPSLKGSLIGRNDYGAGSKSITVDILSDGELLLPAQEIEIGERQYTEEEINDKFQEMSLLLEQLILGENVSLDEVRNDLRLIESIPGYPVSVHWELTNYKVMDDSGKINAENTVEGGTVVGLKAIMTYYSFQGEHSFNAVIYPPQRTDEETFTEEVVNTIAEYEKQSITCEESILPTQIGNHIISYQAPKNYDSVFILILVLGMAVFLHKNAKDELKKELAKRDMQLMVDYPQIISKLMLLTGAGMTIQNAFAKIASDYEKRSGLNKRYAYEEIKVTVHQLEGGLAESEGYISFGNRCRIQKYVKLGAMLAQNLKRGSGRLFEMLEAEEKDAFEERKALARRQGEIAGTKLLAPMGIMLLIVMIIVIMPAFMSMQTG